MGLSNHNVRPEPRWPAIAAFVAIAALRFALPPALSVGPDWVLAPVIAILLLLAAIFHRMDRLGANQTASYLLLAIITADLITSVALLIVRLPAHRETPRQLLTAAIGIWSSNVLVFASWYWRLDGGGPNARDRHKSHNSGAFLFPQMQMRDQNWKPGFVDYLFLAFNTSTAFSPTDVPVLSRWAKAMMMVQSSISLGTVVILAARAVNVL
ncbi:MAG TPA: hypothetical protein VH640_09240 [Bryobacteraceae bacterium]